MPKIIVLTIVLLGIKLCGSFVALLFDLNKFGFISLDFIIHLFFVVVGLGLFVGFFKKKRWAWFGIRCLFLIEILQVVGVVLFGLKLVGFWAAPSPILVLIVAFYLIVVVELGSEAALSWFQFNCPKCGVLEATAYFSFRTRCVLCGHIW